MKYSLYWLCLGFFIINPCKLNAQNDNQKISDTLFFKLNPRYLIKDKQKENIYYLKEALDDKGSSEMLFFKVLGKQKNLHPKVILNIQQYIHSSNFYFPERKKNKLYDFGLSTYLEKKIIFLVDLTSSCNRFIQVYPRTVID